MNRGKKKKIEDVENGKDTVVIWRDRFILTK
jgi:hypothetical protein